MYTCRACGDPHYVTFDGKRYDFQGKCRYSLVKSISGNFKFHVVAKNVEWSRRTSVIRELTISVHDMVSLIFSKALYCKDNFCEICILLPFGQNTPMYMAMFTECVVHLQAYLRLLIGCFLLVGSAMFGATFNLLTRVGLP